MKVVINDCYGGFGISTEAMMKLIEMESDIVQKIPWSEWSRTGDWTKRWGETKEIEGTEKYRRDGFIENLLFDEEGNVYHIDDRTCRDNPDLIKMIEELGVGANSRHSELKIVEIPDDTDWEIEEYDGLEWVAERHRTWG